MSITSEQSNEAMARFLVRRYERIVGEPFLGKDIWLTGNMLEQIEMLESEFLG